MDNQVIKLNYEVEAVPSSELDVFSDFGITGLMKPIFEDRKEDFTDILRAVPFIADLKENLGVHKLIVQIPEKHIKAFQEGLAHLGNSKQIEGNFTPNFYDENGKLLGQATIKDIIDPQALINNSCQIAMMSQMMQISQQLEDLNKKIVAIQQGQKNDRIAKVIGALKTYALTCRLYNTEEERKRAAYIALSSVQEGLTQMHFNLDYMKQMLDKAPKNGIEWAKDVFTNLFRDAGIIQKSRELYEEFVSDLYNFISLNVAADFLLIEQGANMQILQNNHRSVVALLDRTLDDKFIQQWEYLLERPVNEIKEIKEKGSQILIDADRLLESSKDKELLLELS